MTKLENQARSPDHILPLLYCLTHTHIPFIHVLVPNCLACVRATTVTFDVQDWVTTLETEEYYSANNFGLVGADALQEMFIPLLDSLEESGYDFYDLDSQGWGYFDMLVVVHSGDPAEAGPGGEGCDINPPEKRIWSQGHAGAANGWFSSDYAFQVNNFLIVGAYFHPTCSGNPLELGVTAHEYMHGIGLFDFYDEDFEEPRVPIGGTGRFGIMSNP